MIVQGSVTKTQLICNEMPFFTNNNGDIAYIQPYNVILSISGRTHQWSNEIVKALNVAYKYGYEKDRFEWK